MTAATTKPPSTIPREWNSSATSLYVADTENHLIRTIDLENQTVDRLSGTGEQSRVRVPGGPLRGTALNSPWDLQELDGTLYIAMAGSAPVVETRSWLRTRSKYSLARVERTFSTARCSVARWLSRREL